MAGLALPLPFIVVGGLIHLLSLFLFPFLCTEATQVRTSSRDCGVGTLTFPLDSPLLLLQPTTAKRPTKRPQPSLSDREGGPSKRRSSAVALKTEDSEDVTSLSTCLDTS